MNREPSRSIRLTLLRRAYLLPVFVYQHTLSRLMRPCCRFTPTCSQYFVEAVAKKGIVRGTLKGLWRICRCHPWSRGGWDPVD